MFLAMGKELLCPKCGSSNIVGYKRFYECFYCGYKWRTNGLRKRRVILFISCLAIIILVVAAVLAISSTWYLIGSGKVTIKGGSTPPGASIVVVPFDIGNVTIDAGTEWRDTFLANITFEGTPADRFYIKQVILGFNAPPEELKESLYKFEVLYCRPLDSGAACTGLGNFLYSGNIYWEQVLAENGWYYYAVNISNPESFTVGEVRRGVQLSIVTWYPSEDVSFDMKIYFKIESQRI